MKRMCVLMAAVAIAAAAFTGCGNENTKQINAALKDLDQRVSAMEAASKKGDKDAAWDMLWQAMDAQAAVNALVESPAWKAGNAKRYDALVARMTGTYKEGGNKDDDGASNTAVPSIASAFKYDYDADCAWIEGLTKEALGNGVIKSIVIPSTIKGKPVILISNSAFRGLKLLERVTLPESLKKIYSSAFGECVSLKEIKIPASIEELGGFNGCTGLTSVDLSECTNLKKIYRGAFARCTALTSFDLGECTNLKEISELAFSRCTALESVKLPASLEVLSGFDDCTALTSIDLSVCTNLKEIESMWSEYNTGGLYFIGTFEGCTGIKSITIPATVEEMGGCSFRGWKSDQTIIVPWAKGNQPSGWIHVHDWDGFCEATIVYNGGK